MKIQTVYLIALWGMLPVAGLLVWWLSKTRIGSWFNRQHNLIQAVLILLFVFGLMIPMAYFSQMGFHYEYLEKYQVHFYGKTLVFERYIYMPTPDPGDVVAFRDAQGAEQRIWCNNYLGETSELDKKFVVLKPGQRVKFSQTGWSQEDPRPVPIPVE